MLGNCLLSIAILRQFDVVVKAFCEKCDENVLFCEETVRKNGAVNDTWGGERVAFGYFRIKSRAQTTSPTIDKPEKVCYTHTANLIKSATG